MGDHRPVKPDLLFLPGPVTPVVPQEDHKDDDADNIRFRIEEKIIQRHVLLRYCGMIVYYCTRSGG